MTTTIQALLADLEKILAASPVMYRQAKDASGRNEGKPKGTIMAQIPWEMLGRVIGVRATMQVEAAPMIATGLET